MGGKFRENIFFNQERKDKYLNDIPTNQKSALKRIFLASYEQETKLKKDLCDFDREELLKLYSYINATSVNLHCLIKKYMDDVDPANKQKHAEITEGISRGFLLQYCNKVARKYRILSRQEVLDLMTDPVFMNAMDQFVILALFEGIRGVEGCELLNLKRQDVKMENGICIVNLCTGRTVEISERLYNIIMNAIEEDSYMVIRNGFPVVYKLENTDNVIRRSITPQMAGELKYKSIQVRIRKLLASIDLDKQISIKSIFDSGLVNYVKQLAKENNMAASELLNNMELWEKAYTRYGYKARINDHIGREVTINDLYQIKLEIQQYVNE